MPPSPALPPRLDRPNQCLWRGDRRVELSANAFRMLEYLVERPRQIVRKDALRDAVWPDAHVVDAVLSVTISQLRDALGDDPRAPRFIETLHCRGYRWIGTLAPETAPVEAAAESGGLALVGRDARSRSAAASRAASASTATAYLPLLDALQQVVHASDDAIAVLRSRAPTWLLQLPGVLSPDDHEDPVVVLPSEPHAQCPDATAILPR